MNRDISNLVCNTFKDIFIKIINCDVDTAILNGGRSSTKSQVASETILVGCMTNKASAVCLVKYANKIEERLVNTFKDSIRYLGIEQFWKLRRSPFEYVMLDKFGKETDVSIKFTGADNVDMLKSYKPRSGGGFRYVWFEELTNFICLNEVNNIIQTMGRGQGEHCVIMTYNPPMSTSNWVNKEYNAPCGKILGYDSNSFLQEVEFEFDNEKYINKQLIHHSTYLDVIESGHSNWLGKLFIAEASKSKLSNNKYYRWAYLGEVIGTDANVFDNICDWDGCTDNLNITKINRGLDCSNGGADPWMYGGWYYDKKNNDLYCLHEFRLSGKADISNVAENIKALNPLKLDFYIDSAVPTFGVLLRKEMLNALPVKKGADSVMAGVLWLKSLNHIYINKIKTPVTYKEFTEYEYMIDPKTDEITSELVDKNNHSIDACRYANSMNIRFN